MFPLLSPLPVLIPKWRDSERHRSGCFDRLPLFTPQHKLTHTHTHRSQKTQPASCGVVQRRWEEKAGSRKICPSGLWNIRKHSFIEAERHRTFRPRTAFQRLCLMCSLCVCACVSVRESINAKFYTIVNTSRPVQDILIVEFNSTKGGVYFKVKI